MAAMLRAADLARKTAIDTATGLVIVQDGRLTIVDAETLRQEQLLSSHAIPKDEAGLAPSKSSIEEIY